MIDLHSHVLHGVDDGAKDLDQALRMCEIAIQDGCRTLVATPHLRHERYWNDDRRLLEHRFQELSSAARNKFGDDLELALGGEIAISLESLDEIDRQPDDLLAMADTRYLLLEPNFHGMGPDPVEMIYELGLADWLPIIAHPERISWLTADFSLLGALVSHGALLQVTAMSLTGALGPVIQQHSREMVDRGWVHIVASDAHDERIRPPVLSEARREVETHWGQDAGRLFFETHPRAVIDGQPLDPQALPQRESSTQGSASPWNRLRALFGAGD